MSSPIAPTADFETLFRQAPSAFLVLTPDLKIVTASDAYCKATMTKLEDIRGRGLFEVFPDNPNDPGSRGAEIARASYNRVLTTGKADTMDLFKYDIRKPAAEGGGFEERYWLPVNSPVIDKATGKVTFIIHRVEDVTEFVKLRGRPDESSTGREGRSSPGIDPAFQASNHELLNIKYALDKSAIVAFTDRYGTITHVNSKFCEISKYSREELIGKNHRILNSGYHPKEFFAEMWKQISSGKVWEGEIRNKAKDGSFYWVHTTIVPFLGTDGKPMQYGAIRYEITQIKEAQERLRDYASKLETSNRELQDFASVAAHDLQEPLRKIMAFSDRLRKSVAHLLTDEARDYLERMESSAGRMRSLINDLLTFSRVTTKAQPFRPTDLNEVIHGVLSDLEVRIEQTHGKVNLAKLPIIDSDELQMRQLFQNIIANALKFHKPNVAPIVEIQATETASQVELTIADNGIGFEEKYLDRIFTIFQRLHGRHEYEGTGVGLAVCRRIVERHGGMITAKSAPGEGATFIIRLPKRQNAG